MFVITNNGLQELSFIFRKLTMTEEKQRRIKIEKPKIIKQDSSVKGYIEIFEKGILRGWVYDTDQPNASLSIQIYTKQMLVAEGLADIDRQDLKAAGFGNGQHGFMLGLDIKNLVNDIPYPVRILVDGHEIAINAFDVLVTEKMRTEIDLSKKPKVIGRIDRLTENNIVEGWAALKEDLEQHLNVEVFLDDTCIALTEASKFRDDLKKSGLAEGDYGFQVKLEDDIAKKIRSYGGKLSLRCNDFNTSNIVNLTIKQDIKKPEAVLRHIAALIDKIDFSELNAHETSISAQYGSDTSKPLFEKLVTHAQRSNSSAHAPEISPYIHYTLARLRRDDLLGYGVAAYNQAIQYYLRAYSTWRKEFRVPLSAADIDYYNQAINQPLINRFISQATFHYSDLMADIPINQQLNDPSVYRLFVFRWAVDIAPVFAVEDCLVPAIYTETLRNIDFARRTEKFPLNNFSELYYHHKLPIEVRQTLDLNNANGIDRALLYVIILLDSLTRPDFNHYLPFDIHEKTFQEWNEKGLIFSTVVNAASSFSISSHAKQKAELILQDHVFINAQRQRGYAVDQRRYLSITKSGHRIHAAQLPLPTPPDSLFDIQIIGPFAKASGLGQACRLSADTLSAAGFTVNCVDFGLDNPALEGYSAKTTLGELSRARINLIHLNAESIPLAMAYLPDVFTDAYNIGYFFWELNSPATCHYLALDLLDEVWVSSEYNREIYSPYTQIPVTNIGMTVEELDDLDKNECRQYVEDLFGIKSTETVFLTTFDSFSFVQRKNPLAVIRAFQQAFTDNEAVRLLIKTQNRFFVGDPEQVKIWSEIDQLIMSDPRITVINQTMKYRDVLRLKKGCDVYVSLHRSEGWGFGMIEAMNLHIPVICTGYSGNMDFCTAETTWLIDYTLKLLAPNDYIFVVPGQQWAEPSIESAVNCFKEAYQQPKLRQQKAQAAYDYIRTHFSLTSIAKRYGTRINQILNQIKRG